MPLHGKFSLLPHFPPQILPPVLYQTGISDSQTVSGGPDLWESGLGQGGELPLKFTQAVRFQPGH
jgi:hypothetical protein